MSDYGGGDTGGNVKKVYGYIDSISSKPTKRNTTVWKLVIDGKTYNWFKDEQIGFNKGDYVEGLFYEMPNPQGNNPFKNISSLEKSTPPEDYQRPNNEKDPKVFDFGMACNDAAILLSAVVQCSHDTDTARERLQSLMQEDEYSKLVESLYQNNRALRERLLNKGE